MLDPIENKVPAYGFNKGIQSLIQSNNPWPKRELLSRIACLFAATIVCLLSSIIYAVATVVTAITAPLKIPLVILLWIFDENTFLLSAYDKIPGMTDVVRNAIKTAVYAFNAIFASTLGLVRPQSFIQAQAYFELAGFSAHRSFLHYNELPI